MKKRFENGKTESTAVDNELLSMHSSLFLSLCAGLNCIAFLHRPPFALRRNKCTYSSSHPTTTDRGSILAFLCLLLLLPDNSIHPCCRLRLRRPFFFCLPSLWYQPLNAVPSPLLRGRGGPSLFLPAPTPPPSTRLARQGATDTQHNNSGRLLPWASCAVLILCRVVYRKK